MPRFVPRPLQRPPTSLSRRSPPEYLKKALQTKRRTSGRGGAAAAAGPAAATAASELAKGLADSKSEVAEAAGEALIRIGAGR